MRLAAFACFSLFVFGCSSSSEPPPVQSDSGADAAEACVPFDAGPKGTPPAGDAGEDAATDAAPSGPTVTRAQIDDIIVTSCAFSSCHGNKPGQAGLWLPNPMASNWVPNVVNVASKTAPSWKLVVPYDPQNSFLVQKLTSGVCALSKDCVMNNCGDRMPQGSDPLDPSDLQKVIEWVRQGANEK